MVEMSEVMEVIEFASESFANGRRGGVRGRSSVIPPPLLLFVKDSWRWFKSTVFYKVFGKSSGIIPELFSVIKCIWFSV